MTNPIKGLEILQHKIPGEEICQGCGHEHNCRVHGCAMITPALLALATAEKTIKELEQLAFELAAAERSGKALEPDAVKNTRKTLDQLADDLYNSLKID